MNYKCLFAVVGFTPLLSLAAPSPDRLEVSGFGRVVGGYLNTGEVSFEGYDNSVAFDNQSLIALQADFKVTDTLSLTSQALAHSGEERKSGLEWLYVTYEPSQHWQFKGGKMRTPFFRYSDVIDVGFAYPWITAPQQLYSSFLFNHYTGLMAGRRDAFGKFRTSLEFHYGEFDDATYFQELVVPTKVDRLRGLVLNVDYDLNWRFRAGYFAGYVNLGLDSELEQFVDTLAMLGFTQSATALASQGDVDVYQVGVNYDDFFYSFGAEWISIQPEVLGNDTNSFYVTLGLNFQPVSLHLTYAQLQGDKYAESDIPVGVSPQLDTLSAFYNNVTSYLQTEDLDSLSLTARWDPLLNVAFKAEATYYEGGVGNNSFAIDTPTAKFDDQATLYQLAVEFVF